MRLPSKFLAVVLTSLMLAVPVHAQDATIGQDDVLKYLEELINWQRSATSLDPAADNARELVFQETLRQNSIRVLQSGFKFARAEANRQSVAQPDDDSSAELTPAQRMKKRAEDVDARMATITTSLNAPGLTAQQKSDLQDELKLLTAKRELIQTVIANMNAAASGESKGFIGKINTLAHTIPELSAPTAKESKDAAKSDGSSSVSAMASAFMPGLPASAPSTAATPAATQSRPVTSIFSLASDLFELNRQQRELNDFAAQTAHMEQSGKALLTSLRMAMDQATDPAPATPAADAVPDSAVAADATDKEADAKPAAAPAPVLTIDQKIVQFKKIAADILPLGDAQLWIGISKHTVSDWQNLLDQQLKVVLRSLFIRLTILAITLAIPLVIAGVVKRAINRYVHDPKRQGQAQTARRILTWIAILFIVLENFISDFSSFATFAGFLTAGIAVALQSPLLSLVGHFFFYGRYGVRAGDRVTVGGVTGDILQIGMMRFYIRELSKTDEGFEPTGKIVAFPNSILFQPAAFYKYV